MNKNKKHLQQRTLWDRAGKRCVTWPPLFNFYTYILVQPVDDTSGNDAVDDGTGEQVGRGGPSQGHILIATLRFARHRSWKYKQINKLTQYFLDNQHNKNGLYDHE